MTPDNAVRQASNTAAEYLSRAIIDIDDVCGEGYALKHPTLIETTMKIAAADFEHACLIGAVDL